MLAPWKKSYDQPRKHMKKQRHYFVDKSPSSQSYDFSSSRVWMWGLDHKESWAPEIWCFWTVVLEKTLESPLDCKEIKSILKEISPDYSLEGLMLKLQYFGHLMQIANSLEKTLMLGKIDGRRRRRWDGWMALIDMSLSKVCRLVMDREAWRAVAHGVAKSQTRLRDWTELSPLLPQMQKKPCFLNTSELNSVCDVPSVPQGRGKAWWDSVWTESTPSLPQGEWSATPVVMLWPTASYTTPPYRGGQIWFPSL